MASASSNNNKWIGRDGIRPTRGQRAQRAFWIVEVDAILAPVVAVHDQFVLLAK